MKKNILLITYYWPPAGGPSVQRWLKFVKFLPNYNINPVILTVDEKHATYAQIDTSFKNEVSETLKVYKTKSFEPLKYYSFLVGKKNIPVSGFANINKKTLSNKISRFIRGNFFIPDPRKGWNKYAFKEAKKIINQFNIDTVITTGPPNSTHLIGKKLKKRLNIKWICDMRDPWTDIFYYDDMLHLWPIKKLDSEYERKVVENCDYLITVSKGLKEIFENKSNIIDNRKIKVITNGFDPDDFKQTLYSHKNKSFTISYVGTMTLQYKPQAFLKACKQIIDQDLHIKINLIGQLAPDVVELIYSLKLEKNVEIISQQSHQKAIEYMRNSDALLLLIPDTEYSKGILTGKLFEYLASKRPIIFIGPRGSEISEIILNTSSGSHYTYDQTNEIAENIRLLINNEKKYSFENINQYTRQNQTKKLTELISQ